MSQMAVYEQFQSGFSAVSGNEKKNNITIYCPQKDLPINNNNNNCSYYYYYYYYYDNNNNNNNNNDKRLFFVGLYQLQIVISFVSLLE